MSDNETTMPTSWTSNPPTLVKGKCLWTKTQWMYTDLSSETGYQKTYIPQDGSKGDDGLPGKDGVGLKSTTITYAQGAFGTVAPTSGWSSQVPNVPAGQFLWTKTVWTYTDNTNETGYSVSKIGLQGPKGDRGSDGKDGKSLRLFTTQYKYAQKFINQYSADGYTGDWSVIENTAGLKVGDSVQIRVFNTDKESDSWIVASVSAILGENRIKTVSKGLIEKGDQGKRGPKGATGEKGDKGDPGKPADPAPINQLKQDMELTKKDLSAAKSDLLREKSESSAKIEQVKQDVGAIRNQQTAYEQSNTQNLARITGQLGDKASKSEVKQTADGIREEISQISVGGRNLFLNSLFKQDIKKTGIWTTSTYAASTDSANKYLGHSALKIVGQDPVEKDGNNPKITYPALGMFGKVVAGSATDRDVVISFYAKSAKNGTILLSRLGNVGYADNQNVSLTTEIKYYAVKIPRSATKNAKQATNEWLFRLNQADTVWIWMPKFEFGTIDTAYSEAPEDMGSQISAVESSFKQRADSLEAGVTRLTEGLKTKADASAVNVLADSIKQSVKSLETDTQNKLNQKLSTAEFEVRATGIRQEIVNATKDKADKTLVTAEAGKIREEISRISVGGRNLLKGSKGEFKPDRNPSNFDNWQVFYASEIYLEEGKQYIISGKTDGIFSNNHQPTTESDNVVLWFLNKSWTVTKIVSGPDTGTTGTKFIWNNPTGIYCLRVNTYHKYARKKVWEVKVERGTLKTDWSPAPEDTDEQITAARATFEKTAEGLKTDMTAVKSYAADDGKRREQLEQYTRTETARSTEALRKQVSESYVAKSQHTEDVRGITRRFEELTIGGNNLLAHSNFNIGGYYQNALRQDPAYIYSKLIEIKNKNYCLQVWETNDGTKKIWVGMQYFDEAKKPLINGYSSLYFSGYRKYVLEVPETAKYIAISLDKRALNKDEIRFKLEAGSIPTDWSPAPEDTETKLAEYKQTVDGQLAAVKQEVNGKVSQTTFDQRANQITQAVQELNNDVVKKNQIRVNENGIVSTAEKVVNGQTLASMISQNPAWVEIIAKLLKVKADMIVNGAITADKLNIQELSALTSNLGKITAGEVEFTARFRNSPSHDAWGTVPGEYNYDTTVLINSSGIYSNGKIGRKNEEDKTPTITPVSYFKNGELFFANLEAGHSLKYMQINGIHPFIQGGSSLIYFGKKEDGKDALYITCHNAELYLKSDNYTDWKQSEVNNKVRWKVQGSLVLVDFNLQFDRDGDYHLANIPKQYVPSKKMFPVQAWSLDRNKDRTAQLNVGGDLHIIGAERGVPYLGQIIWTY